MRPTGGPAELTNVITFAPREDPQSVWTLGEVRVQAIRSTHMPGHASYRVDTPAGSVVIGGDAGNDKSAPPRDYSTSDQVEKLAKAADVMVHSVIHPIMAPDTGGGFAAPVYNRQSTVGDLGAMARRAGVKHLMLTHMIPPLGADQLGRYKLPAITHQRSGSGKTIAQTGTTLRPGYRRDPTWCRLRHQCSGRHKQAS